MDVKEFLERETGDELGVGIELSFDELGVTQRELNKRVGKVGFPSHPTRRTS